jgi:hypothetical protein
MELRDRTRTVYELLTSFGITLVTACYPVACDNGPEWNQESRRIHMLSSWGDVGAKRAGLLEQRN